MQHLNFKHILIASGAFFAITIGCLWSWNALAELFGGPVAQYKHVIAAALLLVSLRFLVSRRHARVSHRPAP